jgi:Mor family transcriptional regulator
MAKGPETKTERNQNLFNDKEKMTFEKLARVYRISVKRTKEVYYKERDRRNKGVLKTAKKTGKELDKRLKQE